MSLGELFAHAATTDGITVRVQTRFASDQSSARNRHWVWFYHIRIENHSGSDWQLIDRHWIITDGLGRKQEVIGEGVVGQQPLIADGSNYDYVSCCPLSTPMGTMCGRYGMIGPDGQRAEIAIPCFDLLSPDSRSAAN